MIQAQTWQQSHALATPNSQWTAYLNQLCWQTLLPWLQEDYLPTATVTPHVVSLPTFWELTTGTALRLNDRRIILIPTETIDLDEFRIPQEWVDIPTWAGDYYLSAQVNPDEGWVRVAGLATHRQVKTQGLYDMGDRTYTLSDTDLTPDFSSIWVAQQLAPTENLRSELSPIAALSPTQADNLLERLGNPTVLTPRLAVPFEQWAGLLNHGGWRQQLAERRWGVVGVRSPVQWLQSGLSTLAQSLGWQAVTLQPGMAGARGEGQESGVGWGQSLLIQDQPYELRLSCLDPAQNTWRFELQSLVPGGQIPTGFVLRLLTEDLQPFEGNEDRAMTPVDRLFLEVALESGEGLVWEVEPMPQGYDCEILRF